MIFNYRDIFGFDISSHQDSPLIVGTVDFQKMSESSARFCGLRATNGMTEDADYKTFRGNIKGVLPYFAYCYYNNLYDPKYQAQKFFSVVGSDLPPVCVLDLEDRQSGFIGWRHWYDWLVEFQTLSGLPNECIWIYTNKTYFAECSGPITPAQRDWFGRFPLWLASYFADPFHPNWQYVTIPAPWTEIIMLQSGTPAVGIAAGVESRDIDLDLFIGDEERLKQIFGEALPQPPTGEPMTHFGKIMIATLNIRSGPGMTYSDIGDLNNGDLVEASEILGGWWHLSRATRNAAPVLTSDGRTVEQRTDVWASGGSGSYIQEYTPAPLNVYPDSVTLTYADGTKRGYVPE